MSFIAILSMDFFCRIMKENIFGEGLDIPMLGIRMTCQELWPDKTLDLFKDPVFQGPVLINFLQS
jgi:hypothetical protein